MNRQTYIFDKTLAHQENTKKTKLLRIGKIVFLIFVFILVLEVWMANRLSTYGYKIQQMKQLKSEISLQNQLLENEIAQDSSLSIIEAKANKLGFDTIKNIEYIKSDTLAATF